MKSIATSLLFLLLAATSACATDATADVRDVRVASTERSSTVTDTTPARSTQAPASTGTRKHKRCRSYFKTVGIACQKRASR
jgi:hypothetical protein